VWNAEVGEKARFFGGRLSVRSDVYYLRWRDVQQSVPLACGFVYNTNAGDARSYGSELELNARLNDQWSLALSGTVTRARIDTPTTAYASSLVGVNGQPYCRGADRCSIPILNVPAMSAALSVVYTTHLAPDVDLTLRASDTYTGAATDQAYAFGVHLPPYAIGAVRLTLSKGAWSVDAFVDNVADRTALMTANNTQFQYNIAQLTRYTTNEPRTVGMRLRVNF
jgi:outer membrane receptor protein involved in Fe transport